MDLNLWDLFNYVNVQSAVLFAIVLLAYSILLKKEKGDSDCPPGPRGLPIVGNLLSLSLHSERDMYKWSKEYGPVYRLKFGTVEFIILGSLEAVEEAFVKKSDVFSNRMQNTIPSLSGDSGIIFLNYGYRQKEQRRFGLATLKLFGMGRRSLEPKILELCSDLCDEVETYAELGQPVELAFPIYERVSAVISQLVFNKNLPKENKEFREFLHLVMTGSKYSPINAITVFYPALKPIPPFRWGIQEADEQEKATYRMIQEQIDEHKATRDVNEPRDFIDCFLQEMEDRKQKSEVISDQRDFDDEQLNNSVRDLFLAGSETTSTTLCWILLFLSKNLDSQARLHEEIDKILHQKPPSTLLSEKMPFARAVIQESLRMRPVAPIGIPHVAAKDATIMGYRIKKGSCVASNIFGILNDERAWPNPEKFDPARHLDENGRFVKHRNAIPFSIGARQCLGMQLATMELFIFTVSIFQKFSFHLAPGQEIDMKGSNIFTLRPYPFKVVAKRR